LSGSVPYRQLIVSVDAGMHSPEVEVFVVQIDLQLSQLDSKRRRVRQLGRDGERDPARGVVARELEVGDGDVGHVGHTRERQVLESFVSTR
jgi:hypothetical protein